mgnify:FL=1
MLNDPLILEASRVLANNLIREGKEDEEAIKEAFFKIICRAPKEEELALLIEYHQEELKRFKQKPETILETVKAGEFPLDQFSDTPETAALMQVLVAIYNVEEAITKT